MEALLAPSLRRVINASGVILHTNLGRAPVSAQAAAHLSQLATSYSNLEYDLETGERGKRDVHTSRMLANLVSAESAIVVNNNAAAVFLVLNTLSKSAETIVSRGELIEIGDGFRIPDIMAESGAILREVGTTNRTRLRDYERAINERTILELIHRQGPLSRAQAARVSGLSKPTVSLALTGLLDAGLVREVGRSRGERKSAGN